MKNIFKYLSVFAIAGTLGMNVMNVRAEETCGEGETIHTNYYMFLEVNSAEYYDKALAETPEGKSLTFWNGAYKYNNIQKAKIIEQGNVGITKGSDKTVDGAPINWTVTEYWKKYYNASTRKDSNLVYTEGSESYFMHDKWWTYKENFTDGEERSHTNTDRADALSTYLQGNWSSLDRSDLVSKGTSVPDSKVDPPAALDTSVDEKLMWHITRVIADKDNLTGVKIGNGLVVYSPAAYYVKFCEKGGQGGPTEKTITYDANSAEPVVGMPNNQTFTEECATISSARPTRVGYTFVGWSTNPEATVGESQYNPGIQYCGDSITLHAIWSPNQTGPFTITYNANGGKDAPASQSGETGSCVAISGQKPTMQGNNFLGWSTDKNAKEPDSRFAAGQNYCGEQGNIELFAVWQTQTGISAHFVAFAVIAIISGAALVVAQKRDLFKQI